MLTKKTAHLTWLIVALALAIFALAAFLGGPGAAADVDLVRVLAGEGALHPVLTAIAIGVTSAGGAPGMLAISGVAMTLAFGARQWRVGLRIGMIVLGGRGAVELIKLAIARPRPHFGPYPVNIASLSFPSGHAANSMMTLLTVALLLAPPRTRTASVCAAIALSLTIGATRPFLGVHWPSDVIGGWAFGIAWVVALTTPGKASDYSPASAEFRAS